MRYRVPCKQAPMHIITRQIRRTSTTPRSRTSDIKHACTNNEGRSKIFPWNNAGRQSDPNMKCTLVHIGPTMGGVLTLSKLSEAKKFLTSCHLLPEGSLCTVQAMTAILCLMAKTCKMPDNISRAMGHISDVLSHTAQQSNTRGNAESLLTLLKEMQMKLSAEMDSRFTMLKSKLTLPTVAQ